MIGAAPSFAQPEGRTAVPLDLPELAQYVPADVEAFVELERLGEIAMRMDNPRVLRLIEAQVAGEGGWGELLAKSLGASQQEAIRKLFHQRVAFATRKWNDWSGGVILFEKPHGLGSPEVFALFAGDDQNRPMQRVGRVSLQQTGANLWVATNGRVFAISAAWGGGTLLGEVVASMNRPRSVTLDKRREFRQLVADLPSPRYACAYWRRHDIPPNTSDNLWSAAARSGALGGYVRPTGVDLALRTFAPDQGEPSFRPPVVMEPLMQLPQSTLVAWAMQVDMAQALEEFAEHTSEGVLEPLWRAANDAPAGLKFLEEVFASMGPRAVFVVGGDFTTEPLSPQISILCETINARAVVEGLRSSIMQIADEVSRHQEDGSRPLDLVVSDHLGTLVFEVRFDRARQPEDAPAGFAELAARHLQFSFAQVGDWVAISTAPGHVHELIDAANGMTPSLGAIPEMQLGDVANRRAVSLGVVQPALTMGVLGYWREQLATMDHTNRTPSRLGISVRIDSPPGQVVVADVDSNGPSADLLRVEDRIIACEDVVLPLDDTSAYIRKLIAASQGDAPMRFRVLRGEELVDVNIDLAPQAKTASPAGLDQLMRQLEPLAPFADALSAAIYVESRPDVHGYRGELLLRFKPKPGGEQPESVQR